MASNRSESILPGSRSNQAFCFITPEKVLRLGGRDTNTGSDFQVALLKIVIPIFDNWLNVKLMRTLEVVVYDTPNRQGHVCKVVYLVSSRLVTQSTKPARNIYRLQSRSHKRDVC